MAKELDPLTWFQRGDEFQIASYVLHEHVDKTLGAVIRPSIITRAFAVEAYLKCLIALDGRAPRKIHNLLDIFKELPLHDRRHLKRLWREDYTPLLKSLKEQNLVPKMKVLVSLEGNLKLSGDAFVDFRYIARVENPSFGLMDFPLRLREYILLAKPEFRPQWDPLALDPKTKLIEAEKYEVTGFTWTPPELNRKPPAFNFTLKVGRRSDADNGGAG